LNKVIFNAEKEHNAKTNANKSSKEDFEQYSISVSQFVTNINNRFISKIGFVFVKGQLVEIKKYANSTYAKLRDEKEQVSVEIF
jgi:hypothetical protein